ncbi:MAG: transcription elongation factor GreA [Clostridiales bacterium]|nr:transcription elongation factor GreA [Clostridiales bacterium]
MDDEKKTILTEQGYRELENELRDLKGIRRREIAEKIKEARAQGDLSENAEYDSAKDEQAQIEARILELDNLLKRAKIIKAADGAELGLGGGIALGNRVRLVELDDGGNEVETVEFAIVGSAESDPFNNKISNESPLGKALLDKASVKGSDGETVGYAGHKKGDLVYVETPSGTVKYKILEII